MCLCPNCHDCIHWFRSEGQVIKGKGEIEGYPISYLFLLRTHFCAVNHCTPEVFDYYLRRMHRIRDRRTRHDYELDYGMYSVSRIEDSYKGLKG